MNYMRKIILIIKDLKIALLTDGLFSDTGWGAFAYNAAHSLEIKYGYDIDFKENVAIPDIEIILREYANAGFDLIIAHGFEWGTPAIKVAKDYPSINFVIFTGLVKATNVSFYFSNATRSNISIRSTRSNDV